MDVSADFTVRELSGRWRSPEAAEVFPGIYGVDDFWLHSPFWAIHFNSYKDPGCENRLFELVIMGMFELLGPSSRTPGARDADFSRIRVSLRLFDPGLIAGADGVGAGDGHWVPGEWQDVSHRGCSILDLPGAAECPIEYDLLGLARSGAPDGGGDRLYFGQRHHDEAGSIWTRRAPGLLDYHVVRVTGEPPRAGHGAEWGPADWTRLTSTCTLTPDDRRQP
ncbi:hypothetical protein MF672_043615 [Actinomadura sp. ATCC 31491]|uniref:APCDD1 domain-containing protein n=1 Tax=Actinomadura luzonensis TaxID=2805427 RepID=A0ABT0G7R8_9ACTN|nr:hypothetical protein [Actinomadura luzonensis]MCK2220646.1 hypothetical protein [Actinomadura luzonensis]